MESLLILSETQEALSLIHETLSSFYKRAQSATVQTVIYSTLTLLLFAWLYHKPFSWPKIVAFSIGALSFSLSATLSSKNAQKALFPNIENGVTTPKELLNQLYQASLNIALKLSIIILLGFGLCFSILGSDSVIGFSLGATLAMVFLRLGGSVYKSASDIGADIIQAREKKLPLTHKQNPLTILDWSGELLGKLTGFGSDLMVSLITACTTIILLASHWQNSGELSPIQAQNLSWVPFLILIGGFFSCLLAFAFCKIRIKNNHITNVLLEGLYIASLGCGLITWAILTRFPLTIPMQNGFLAQPFLSYAMGLIGAVLFGFGSEYLTSHKFLPAKKLAQQAEYGPAFTLLNALALGKKSQLIFLASLLIVLIPAFINGGVLGIALATLAMLSVAPIILTITYFSSLANISHKIAVVLDEKNTNHKVGLKVNNIGNTTAALGTGFAAATSVLGSCGLFLGMLIVTKTPPTSFISENMHLPLGVMIGISQPIIFSGFLISGLTSTIKATQTEVLRQFKEIPYLIEGKANPDMVKASDVIARTAMDSLILPGIVMVLVPIILSFVFGKMMLIGLALGTILHGVIGGFSPAITGGVLNSAKHIIQSGSYGGKESTAFQAATVADNIGESFEDIISPSSGAAMRGIIMIIVFLILFLGLG